MEALTTGSAGKSQKMSFDEYQMYTIEIRNKIGNKAYLFGWVLVFAYLAMEFLVTTFKLFNL